MLEGTLKKMRSTLEEGATIFYELPLGEERVPLNPLLGQGISLHFQGDIHCVHCNRKIKKSFNQGFCYPCFQKLPQADLCQVKPEACHFAQGSCRDSEWGKANCFIEHTIYLANASGVKVGITRSYQQTTRWIDQGAIAALPILKVSNRKDAGLMELAFKKYVADKTNWRAMLKGEVPELDLIAKRNELYGFIPANVPHSRLDAEVLHFHYPILTHPQKIKTFNFDKSTNCEGTLLGIKGQYLILDTGVLNIRKFGGYKVKFRQL